MKLKYLPILFLSLSLTGCSLFHDSTRIRGGSAKHSSLTGSNSELVQSQDPKDKTSLNSESELNKRIVVPAGSTISIEEKVVSKDMDSKKFVTNSTTTSILLSSNAIFETNIKDKTQSNIGGSQENVIGLVTAKLKSMKFVSFIGIGLFIVGLACLFWPPAKLIIGSQTTSIAIAGGGLLLTILPYLIIGQEKLILFCVLGAVVGYFFIYRYSQASTKAKIYKDFIDLDKNGVDDREENKVDKSKK